MPRRAPLQVALLLLLFASVVGGVVFLLLHDPSPPATLLDPPSAEQMAALAAELARRRALDAAPAAPADEPPAATRSGNERRNAPPPTPCEPPPPLAGRIVGVVVDAFGWPIADAPVVARGAASGEAATRSDSAGCFALAVGADARDLAVVAAPPGFLRALRHGVSAGESIRLAASQLASMVVRVHDAEQRPIAGATVAWSFVGLSDLADLCGDGVTAADGSCELGGVPCDFDFWSGVDLGAERDRIGTEACTRVRVAAEGFAPFEGRTRAATGKDGVRRPECDVTLERATLLVVRGVVVDAESGAPIEGASVVLSSPNLELAGSLPAHARSGGDGAFELATALRETSGELGVVARARGHVVEIRRISARELLAGAIELRCLPAATLVGSVVDDAGRPVAGALVVDELQERRQVASTFADDADAPVRSGADGRFVLDGTSRSGAVTLLARTEATVAAPRRRGAVTVILKGAATLEAPPIVVLPQPMLFVAVEERAGRPVAGALLTRTGVAAERARSDAAGRAALRLDVPGAPGALLVTAPGFATLWYRDALVATTPAAPLVLRLERERRLVGRLRWSDRADAPRRRAPSGRIEAYATSDELEQALAALAWRRAEADGARRDPGASQGAPPYLPPPLAQADVARDGWFELRGLPAGRCHLLCSNGDQLVAVKRDVALGGDGDGAPLDWRVALPDGERDK